MNRTAFAFSLVALLGGCASFSPDGGFGTVDAVVRERTGQEPRWIRSDAEADSVRARVKELLAQPLSADRAVQVALLNNPALQASYADMGIAEADLVQASRWSGPTFSFARLRRGPDTEFERSVFLDVLGLLVIPLRTRVEEKRFEAARARAAADSMRLALEARKAFFSAIAARESAQYMEQVRSAAEASAELGRRMAAVGNWSKLNHQREQAFYAETTAQLARVRQAQVAARERLARTLGLRGDDPEIRLPERLPDLPATPHAGGDLEVRALAQRLDVQAARRETEAMAQSLGLSKVHRFVNLLELGVMHNTESPKPHQRGWEVELRIPIFDFGEARVARSEFIYMQAVNRAADTAIRARAEVRESYSAYRTAYDLARHYRDEIVPLRKRISEEMLLRYNGMLSSVFELLADARESVASVNANIVALRDFWIAESDLQAALTTGSPGSAPPSGHALSTTAGPAPH